MNPETTTTNRLRPPRDSAPSVSGALDEREEAGARPRRGLRHFWVWVHRYAGLAMTLFLIIVGLTGSVLAFYSELDLWLNPELLSVPVRDAPLLDPVTLLERAEALEPRARIDRLYLHRQPAESYSVYLSPKADPATGKDYVLPYDELFLEPYTGERLGARKWGEVSLAKENLLPFLYRLHYSLALPERTGSLGGYVLGITALVWTLDCFIGFYLTLPAGRKKPRLSRFSVTPAKGRHPSMLLAGAGVQSGLANAAMDSSFRWNDEGSGAGPAKGSGVRSFWQRWKPAWLIKKSRFNYDLHRASGLWVWPMLFVFAWSSVALNLEEVYSPVMKTFFTLQNAEERPELDPPLESPALGWREAYAQGQRFMREAAATHGFTVEREESLYLDRAHGVYQFHVKNSQDWGEYGRTTAVVFDANTGALKRLTLPATEASGDVLTRWLVWLHTARVFGMPMQIFVCAMGLLITALSVTGMIIWLRKRRAPRQRARRDPLSRAAVVET